MPSGENPLTFIYESLPRSKYFYGCYLRYINVVPDDEGMVPRVGNYKLDIQHSNPTLSKLYSLNSLFPNTSDHIIFVYNVRRIWGIDFKSLLLRSFLFIFIFQTTLNNKVLRIMFGL